MGDGGPLLTLQDAHRTYRTLFSRPDLVYFQVVVRETDLCIGIRRERLAGLPHKVDALVRRNRLDLETYISSDPAFLRTLQPYPAHPNMPPLAQEMALAADIAGVGPMAAVAGAFADLVGRYLSRCSRDVIVENGGDIYLKTTRRAIVGVYAGDSPFSGRLALEIRSSSPPLGICTSSGTVGHSLSEGCADAVVILACSAALSDAVATAAANRIHSAQDIQPAVNFALALDGVYGAVAIKNDSLAAGGDVKLVQL